MSYIAPIANAISFVVPGILPGWQRAGQSGKRHYTQQQTAAAQAEVAAWARQAMAGKPLLGGPRGLGLLLVVGVPVPASWPSSRRVLALSGMIRPTPKPDFDNYLKHVDALKGIVWRDDAEVCDGRGVKFYVEHPRTVIRVWELPATAPESFFEGGSFFG